MTDRKFPWTGVPTKQGQRGFFLKSGGWTIALVLLAGSPFSFAGEAAIRIPVAKVTQLEDKQTRSYPGKVVAMASVQVASRVNGEILRLGFRNGDMVTKGQELFQLDSVKYAASVQYHQAKIAEYKAKTAYAENNYERKKNLFDQKAIDRDSLENVMSELEYNRALLASAEAELISAAEDLSHCVITAKIDGMIGTPNFTSGNYVSTGSGPLATVIQMNPVRVRFSLSNRDLLVMFGNARNLLEHGQVSVFLANDSEYGEKGTIEYFDNEASASTDTLRIYATFPNPRHVLIPGSSVSVVLSNADGVMMPAVPLSAIMQDVKGSFVYLVPPSNIIQKQYIVRGSLSGDYQLVLSGSMPDDVVVVDGNHKVSAGVPVEPVYQ